MGFGKVAQIATGMPGIDKVFSGFGGGGGSSVGSQRMKTEPWGPAQGEMGRALDAGEDVFESGQLARGLRYGPHSAVPGMNQNLSQGYGQIGGMGNFGMPGVGRRMRMMSRGRGTGLDALDPNALGALQGTASGQNLFGGQGFNEAVDASLRYSTPAINQSFGGAGRTGSAYHARALGDAASNAFAGQYGQERQNQLGAANSLGSYGMQGVGQQQQAAGMMPGLQQAQYLPAQMRMGAGAQQYGLFDQPGAQENVQRWQQNQMSPWLAAQQFGNFANAAGSGGQMQTGGGGGGGGGGNRLGSAAGGAMTGAAMGSVVPGIGTGFGALIGGGLGFLSGG